MAGKESRDPTEGSSDLERPVDPHARIASADARSERHLLRRVIAPAILLLVSVPVVAVLVLNLRAVSDATEGDSEPASAATSPSSGPSDRPSASAAPAPSEPRVRSISATAGSVDGGLVLTVQGTDLDPVTQVLFGQLSGANLQHVSSSVIRVTTPLGAAGRVPLTFRTGSDEVPSDASRTFTYR